jgi:hypothetical protein
VLILGIYFFNFNNLLEFSFKSCQNFQNTPHFFLGKKNSCIDLGVGQNLTEFAKIPMLESLKKI